ncbi:hypothetical protein KFL_010930030 [Klebsormidium nitens]|uniref:Uncharacterized protein n=1 Tax=Klebsormidium nitens TaxID=105231 RepID=A0A1Y1IPP8_KLENI|nr:hypothetical protein KFL_010930030 [Klebsormidium nitens]|eukprot:GAQ92684.1 hypothetical protein KFL_010930030 [Klebsormidium nitens]
MMVELKNEHPSLFPWLLPYPGDWHFCLNLHPVYKKIYFDAGLIDLAPLMGYPHDATILKEGTNFRRNNLFKLRVWEAMFRFQLKLFWKSGGLPFLDAAAATELEEEVRRAERPGPPADGDTVDQAELPARVQAVLDALGVDLDGLYVAFMVWGKKASESKKTWRFWWDYVHQEGLAYVSLFLAIRTGNWNLKMAVYVKLAPLVRSQDRTHYQQLVPIHLADMQAWPSYVVRALANGAWVANLSGRPHVCLGKDECHECLVNLNVKGASHNAVSSENLQIMTNTLPYIGEAVKNVHQQVDGLGRRNVVDDKESSNEGTQRYSEINIQNATNHLLEHGWLSPELVPPEQDRLGHLFKATVATKDS